MERQNEPSKEKRTVKLNVLDFLIIFVLIVALAAIGVRIYSVYRPFNNGQTYEYRLTVKMNAVFRAVPNYLHEGDSVWFDDGRTLGTVSLNEEGHVYKASPASLEMTTTGGDTVLLSGTDEEKIDAICVFSCSGKTDDNGFFLCEGVTPLTPGQIVSLHTEWADFTVTIVSIEQINR